MLDHTYTLEEICTLVGLPSRTARYYIQMELVDRPEGETRAARYSEKHLEQLLTVKRLTQAGLSLDAVRLQVQNGSADLPFQPSRRGAVEVRSHLVINEGVELQIEPGRAGLTPEQVRELMRHCLDGYERIKGQRTKEGRNK